MKRHMTYLIIFAVAVFLPFGSSLWAGEKGEEGGASAHASISAGASFNGKQSNIDKAAEYDSIPDDSIGTVLGGSVNLEAGRLEFGAQGMFYDSDANQFSGELEFDRFIRAHADYQRFYHRLGQEELVNLRATSAGPKQGAMLWHTYSYAPNYGVWPDGTVNDLIPHKDFGLSHSEVKSGAEFLIPALPGVTIGVHQRTEWRKGNEQVMAMTKCSSCHIVAHDKQVDEKTNDIEPFIEAKLGQLTMKYSFLYREFNENAPDTVHYYDQAFNPISGKGAGTMSGGLNYQDSVLSIDRTPDSRKTMHSVKAKYDFSGRSSLYVGYVNAQMSNRSSENIPVGTQNGMPLYGRDELETDYNAGMISWSANIMKGLAVFLKGRYQNIDSDSADIDLLYDGTVPSLGGPWRRESDENRDIYTATADIRYRLTRTISMGLGYEYNGISRDHAHFLVDEDTNTHKAKLSATWRLASNLTFGAKYHFTYNDAPYTWHDAIYANDGSCGMLSDGVCNIPNTTYDRAYSTNVYGTRSRNTTMEPEYLHNIMMKANWSPLAMLNVGAYAKYDHGRNTSDIDYAYNENLLDTGLDFTVTPMEKLSLTLGYNYFGRNTDSKITIPFYHG